MRPEMIGGVQRVTRPCGLDWPAVAGRLSLVLASAACKPGKAAREGGVA